MFFGSSTSKNGIFYVWAVNPHDLKHFVIALLFTSFQATMDQLPIAIFFENLVSAEHLSILAIRALSTLHQ
jgi:hypothetical protein